MRIETPKRDTAAINEYNDYEKRCFYSNAEMIVGKIGNQSADCRKSEAEEIVSGKGGSLPSCNVYQMRSATRMKVTEAYVSPYAAMEEVTKRLERKRSVKKLLALIAVVKSSINVVQPMEDGNV